MDNPMRATFAHLQHRLTQTHGTPPLTNASYSPYTHTPIASYYAAHTPLVHPYNAPYAAHTPLLSSPQPRQQQSSPHNNQRHQKQKQKKNQYQQQQQQQYQHQHQHQHQLHQHQQNENQHQQQETKQLDNENASTQENKVEETAALDSEIFCEPCERSFKTKGQYEAHVQKHIPCDVEGCKFVGVPKALAYHKDLMHSSTKKFASLDSPEEIQKYIEERKKNFPTKENIVKKEEEYAKKIERGDLLNDPRSRRQAQKGRERNDRKRNHADFTGVDAKKPRIYKDGESSDSTSEDDNEASERAGERSGPNHNESRQRPLCRFMRKGHCRLGNRCKYSHNLESSKGTKASLSGNDRTYNPKSHEQPKAVANISHKTLKPTLLEKLLRTEIRREMSVLLQTIRYLNQKGLLSQAGESEPV